MIVTMSTFDDQILHFKNNYVLAAFMIARYSGFPVTKITSIFSNLYMKEKRIIKFISPIWQSIQSLYPEIALTNSIKQILLPIKPLIFSQNILFMHAKAGNFDKSGTKSPNSLALLVKTQQNSEERWKKEKIQEQLSAVKLKTQIISNALKKTSSQSKGVLELCGKSEGTRKDEKNEVNEESLFESCSCSFSEKVERSFKKLGAESGKKQRKGERQKIYNIPYILQEQFQKQMFKSHKINPEERDLQTIPKNYTESISTNSSIDRKSNKLGIHDFHVGKSLGAGKFGQVYLAMHKQTGFVCALKEISIRSLDDILQTQLIREIKIQMFLNHPNIVKLYTFFKDEKSQSIYLVLELCISGQLYSLLKRREDVPEELGKVIIRQICQGLDYIHENNIIHRDLKPQNVLYQNGMMKICDFGWSVDTHLMRETFCGTPLYVSPELLKKNFYDNKVDTWSLGILSYEILIGKVPFEIYTETDCIKIVTNEVCFPKYPEISEEAKDFIRKCMSKNPETRLTSSQLLEHPFLNKVELLNFPQIF